MCDGLENNSTTALYKLHNLRYYTHPSHNPTEDKHFGEWMDGQIHIHTTKHADFKIKIFLIKKKTAIDWIVNTHHNDSACDMNQHVIKTNDRIYQGFVWENERFP